MVEVRAGRDSNETTLSVSKWVCLRRVVLAFTVCTHPSPNSLRVKHSSSFLEHVCHDCHISCCAFPRVSTTSIRQLPMLQKNVRCGFYSKVHERPYCCNLLASDVKSGASMNYPHENTGICHIVCTFYIQSKFSPVVRLELALCQKHCDSCKGSWLKL